MSCLWAARLCWYASQVFFTQDIDAMAYNAVPCQCNFDVSDAGASSPCAMLMLLPLYEWWCCMQGFAAELIGEVLTKGKGPLGQLVSVLPLLPSIPMAKVAHIHYSYSSMEVCMSNNCYGAGLPRHTAS